MAATVDRYQNPVLGDTVRLKLFVFNSNNFSSLDSVNGVNIYYLDRGAITTTNPDGRVFVQTLPASNVINPEVGQYELDLYLDPTIYTEVGRYIDEWNVVFSPGDQIGQLDHLFQVYPDLWFTSPLPVVYDFSFYFQPNKIKFGSKKFIEIEIIPNVPRATDLCAYYENLAISAILLVTISQRCGTCIPCEQDLRTVVDAQPAQYREKNRGFYFIDTTQFDCGIYDIFFTLNFGANTYVSDTNQLQIYI
jgi:hypothetical protein